MQSKNYYLWAMYLIVANIHGMTQASSSLSGALKKFGYDSPQERTAFLNIFRCTGGFSLPISPVNNDSPLYEKQNSFIIFFKSSNIQKLEAEIYTIESNKLDLIADKIKFPSIHCAQAFVLAATQCLWFRASYKNEVTNNPSALLQRWVKENDSNEDEELIKSLAILGLVSEIKRPSPDFMPSVIIWLGAIQPSAENRIYGDIPDNYAGKIVVHSNRRGLILNKQVWESYGVFSIAEKLGLSNNNKALEIITETCKNYNQFYSLKATELQESTKLLRQLILENLIKANFLEEKTVTDFYWPTEKELYSYMFNRGIKKIPQKLAQAKLTFDDPEPLSNNRIYDTTTEAAYWLKKQLTENAEQFQQNEKPKLLALSIQPFVLYQHECLKDALDKYYTLATIGPEASQVSVKDALESLAKMLYIKAKRDSEIKKLIYWLR